MAYILKAGEVITDNFENSYSDAITAIDIVRIVKESVDHKQVTIVLKQFHTQAARTAWKGGDNTSPLNTYRYPVTARDFDTYFSVSALASYSDIFEAGYDYLNTVQPSGNIEWGIWEIDE